MADGNENLNGQDGQQQPPNGQEQQPNNNNQGGGADKKLESLPKWAQELITTSQTTLATLGDKVKAFETKEQEAATQRQADEKKRLEEQGEFKTLAEQRQAEIDSLKGEIAKRDRDLIVTKVLTANGLAPELAGRLVGNTEAELNADAANLAKLVKTPPIAGAGQRPRPAANTPNPANSVPVIKF